MLGGGRTLLLGQTNHDWHFQQMWYQLVIKKLMAFAGIKYETL